MTLLDSQSFCSLGIFF